MASYHGHGLAIESLKIQDHSDVQLLQEENQRLQAQLQYLHELLSLWQPETCSFCQLHSKSAHSSSNGTRSRASTATRDSASTYAAVDRILRQQQVLIAQQQRQLLVLQAELSSRQQVVLEAEALLAETHRTIAALGGWASQHTQQQQGAAQPTGPQARASTPATTSSAASAVGSGASRRLVPSSSLGNRTGTSGSFRTPSAGAAAAAPVPVPGGLRGTAAAAAGSTQQVCAVVVDHCRSLLTWCRESDARLARAKAASAAQSRCPSQSGSRSSQPGLKQRAASSSSGGSSKPQWQSPDKAAAAAAAATAAEGAGEGLQLQYIPAGGNSCLQPGSVLTLPDIAAGLGTSALAAPALQHLLHLLATLAAPLAAFAVQLRSIVLPALPWVQASELATDLPSSCAQLAQQSATAAVKLAELCAVLPAVPGVLTAPAAHTARRVSSQLAVAAADAGCWGAPQQSHAASAAAGAGDDVLHPSDSTAGVSALDADDSQLLQELANILSHQRGSALGGKGGSSHPRSSLSGKAAAPSQATQQTGTAKGQPSAGALLLERLQARFHVLQLKHCVLNEQLGFLAKCSAAQAKLMARLATDVLQTVCDALGAAEPPSLQQQRSRAVQLCSQLQRASLLVQQQQQRAGGSAGRAAAVLDDGAGAAGGSSALLTSSSFSSRSVGVGSSTARTVLALLEDNRELLNAMPKLLAGASGSALESAATAAVAACLNDFRAALQP